MAILPNSMLLSAAASFVLCAQAFLQPAAAQLIEGHETQENIVAQTPLSELREKMRGFVKSFYLSGNDLSRDELREIYARKVDYFGGKQVGLNKLVRDKLSYFRRWPNRSYTLDDETLAIWKVDDKQLVGVWFEYDFEVYGARRRSTGRGESLLIVDFSVPGGRIVREQGKVIRRGRR
ncbi:MAG: hypothetical protein K0U74_15540 [Alphaproteobacteria bacterium]|nr:hypothetical protein [Alphaproteobacteria bacterium]